MTLQSHISRDTAETARTGAGTGTAHRDTRGPLLFRVLTWLAERDRRYREAQKLRSLPRERLDDMGMSRSDVETVRSGTFRAW